MSDQLDEAFEIEERERKAAIQNVMSVTGNERLTGWCQNDCGERTNGAFCSADCRRDKTMRERMT